MTDRLRWCACLLVLFWMPAAAPAADHWIGSWATAAQHWNSGHLLSFHNQTVRLIVHLSAGGSKARIRISNTYGDQPLRVDAARIARRLSGAEIDPASDRAVTFEGQKSVTVAAHASVVSDPVDIDVPPLSDLAVSLFFRGTTLATTIHLLAQQTNYVSPESGDSTAEARFTAAKTIVSWPFLTAVDVAAPPRSFAIVAFGSSLTDGDGTTKDANTRWPDALAERLQKCLGSDAAVGVLNEGIIGNRLLQDSSSPRQRGGPFGAVYDDLAAVIGESGLARFDRDVLQQSGVKYVVLALGINDILFPGTLVPAGEAVDAPALIAGYRALLKRGHENGVRVIISTVPACEGAVFRGPTFEFYTAEKEKVRARLNEWIRSTREFDGMIDFDAAVRDPNHPSRLLPQYDSGDHLHPNDAGSVASGNVVPLALFGCSE